MTPNYTMVKEVEVKKSAKFSLHSGSALPCDTISAGVISVISPDYCQAQPKPKPNPQLGAEIALLSV